MSWPDILTDTVGCLHFAVVPDAGEEQDGTESETVAGIVCQTPIKDAAHFYVHSSHLCPGEMERKVPALTISAQAFDRSMIHVFMHLLQTNASPSPAVVFFFSYCSNFLHTWLCSNINKYRCTGDAEPKVLFLLNQSQCINSSRPALP